MIEKLRRKYNFFMLGPDIETYQVRIKPAINGDGKSYNITLKAHPSESLTKIYNFVLKSMKGLMGATYNSRDFGGVRVLVQQMQDNKAVKSVSFAIYNTNTEDVHEKILKELHHNKCIL